VLPDTDSKNQPVQFVHRPGKVATTIRFSSLGLTADAGRTLFGPIFDLAQQMHAVLHVCAEISYRRRYSVFAALAPPSSRESLASTTPRLQ
jgi:hypothetical protein